MENRIQQFVVVGAGSAGLMSSMAIKRAFPTRKVVLVYAPEIPVIGVGESTTTIFPGFLHRSLGLGYLDFFREVQPSWKLGIRFHWGDPKDTHFNYVFDHCMTHKPAPLRKLTAYYCLDDWTDASRCWALMDRGLSPCHVEPDGRLSTYDAFGYHINNEKFLKYLMKKSQELGVEHRPTKIVGVERNACGNLTSLQTDDGNQLTGDLFVDCSGFQSRLLGDVMQQPFVSYRDSLFCDRAVVGGWQRNSPILPYTTVDTMNHGWCWRIEFPDRVTRGYVYSSEFCSDDQAIEELKSKNPELESKPRVLSFQSGRRQNFWVGNVVGIGNATGFVEPLEATALHLVIEQIRLLCRLIDESEGDLPPKLIESANQRYRQLWDEVRDFLAIHYRFNRRKNTPFWQHCREATYLAGAQDLVNLYEEAGPTSLCSTTLDGGHLFGYDGFMSILVGSRAPTRYANRMSIDDLRRWHACQTKNQQAASNALTVRDALDRLGV